MHDSIVIELPADAVMRLPDRPRAMLTCLSGVLWITHDGDCSDNILEPRMTYQRPLSGAVVQALCPSRMAFRTAGAGRLALRRLLELA
jgi:hypothetical protein